MDGTSRRVVFVLTALIVLATLNGLPAQGQGRDSSWVSEFSVNKSDLVATGRHDYFVLEPGYQMVLEEEEEQERLTITVTNETKMIAGVETRVVEERETVAGQLAEFTRNYYAIDKRTNDVYYFGEEVDVYQNGKLIGHEGSWVAGVNGATFGLMLPGKPSVHAKYYSELAPGVAMDRIEIVGLNETVATEASTFRNCLKLAETSDAEPDTVYRYYAPNVGLVQTEDLKLVKYGKVQAAQ